MRKTAIALVLASTAALSACTTTERDATVGAGVGAIAGGILGGGRGAVIGTVAGAAGGVLLRQTRNGLCEYRDRSGRIYTDRC